MTAKLPIVGPRTLGAIVLRAVPLVALSLVLSTASCNRVASSGECDAVADHIAALQVKKERIAPLGRLAGPPFNGPENEKAIRDEARESARARCAKGWKRVVVECMMSATDLESADRCRSL